MGERDMKVAVIAPTNIPAMRANTFQVMKMTQALVARGHEVYMAAPGWPPKEGDATKHWK